MDPRSSRRWWLKFIVHNAMIHPFLPVADLLDYMRPNNRLSRALFAAHDLIAPEGGG